MSEHLDLVRCCGEKTKANVVFQIKEGQAVNVFYSSETFGFNHSNYDVVVLDEFTVCLWLRRMLQVIHLLLKIMFSPI